MPSVFAQWRFLWVGRWLIFDLMLLTWQAHQTLPIRGEGQMPWRDEEFHQAVTVLGHIRVVS